MRFTISSIIASLLLTGCGHAENIVSLPAGEGAWVALDQAASGASGNAVVASRDSKGHVVQVKGQYLTHWTGFGVGTIEVRAQCGTMYFDQVAGEISYKDPDRASSAAGAHSCGFGDRLMSSRWKLVRAN